MVIGLLLAGLVIVAVWLGVASVIDGADGMTSDQLYAVGMERAEAALAVRKAAKAANRAETDEELAQIDALLADAATARDLGDKAQAREQREQRLADAEAALTKPQARVTQPTIAKSPDRAVTSGLRERAKDDPTAGFSSSGEMALSVANAAMGQGIDTRLQLLATMNQTQGSAGGYAVPKTHLTEIIDGVLSDELSLLNLCDRYPVVGESVDMPALDETSRADGSRGGGLVGYWKAEQTQMSATDTKLRQIKLEPQELYVYSKVTNKLLRNAPTLTAFLNKKVPQEIQFKINDAIINGTGAGMPQGVLAAAALVAVGKKVGQPADTFIWENAKAIRGRVAPRSFQRGVWLINQEDVEQLEGMHMPVGTGGVPVYMPAGGISERQYSTLYGRPVLVCEQSPALGDQGDVMFFDGAYYMIGWKGMVDQSMSIHLEFDYNRTCFRWVLELDGQPSITAAITPYKGTKTLSPFVTVEAR